ncbi:response regulator [Sphingobacterium sp. DN00404]|uniref:histidine kinase n=1 Tax=Sphingobacterium micropteri TaxID=2763501 RepID=A0ABR7YUQ0_9SPHI|nr:hybrid sensor histidine kinase/response regulator transcription factor [Sphingobacterium micropteri]MBD1435078.1 response regulator [Sphingobacterium micropteri]
MKQHLGKAVKHGVKSSRFLLAPTRLLLFLLAIFYISIPHLKAQINCKIEHYSGEDGISHGTITAVVKDCDGFLWLGTWNGLNRFDGKHFKTYKSTSNNKPYLDSERIVQLEETVGQLLWIRTYDAQVYFFDKKRERFTSVSSILTKKFNRQIIINKIFKINEELLYLASADDGLYQCIGLNSQHLDFVHIDSTQQSPVKLISNQINFLHQDSAKHIWVGAQQGLSTLSDGQETGLSSNEYIQKETIGLNVIEAREDENQIYFSTTNGILLIYNKQTHSLKKIVVSEPGTLHILLSNDKNQLYISSTKGKLFTYDIYGSHLVLIKQFNEEIKRIYEDRKGNLWLEPYYAGAILWNRELDQTKHLRSTFGRYESNVPFQCFEDRQGLLWITLKGGGFGYYNAEKEALITKNSDDFGNHLAFPQQIYSFFYDDGIIWLCSEEKGLIKLQVRDAALSKGNLAEILTKGGDPEVRSLLYDRKGRIWIGTKGGTLVVKEGEAYKTAPIVNIPKDGFSGLYSLLEDHKGNIWMATKNHGVYVASSEDNGNSYRVQNFRQNNSNLPINQIYSLLLDEDGDVWLGTFGAGLVQVIQKSNRIDFRPTPFDNEAYPEGSFDKVRHLCTDKVGNIWIATTFGLVVYDRKGEFRTFKDNRLPTANIEANDLQYILRRSNNEMWICTSGGGISRAIGDPFGRLEIENLSTQKGLSNDYVLSGIEDANGDLWFATEGGLSKYDTKIGYFFTFDSFYDRARFSFAEKTVIKTAFGEIIWGTNKGVIDISPTTFSAGRGNTTLVFSHLWVNNKEMTPNPKINGQEFHVQYTDQLILNHDQNNISLDFTIIDYRHSRHTYLYRLIGLDTTWHSNQHLNRITFTNLKPGNYLLEVKGHSDLYETAPYKSLAIIVSSPWWQTWWAYTLYIILGLSGLVLGWRILSTMLSLKNRIEIEKRVATLKMTFFTNVSHELRTPLTLILSPVKQLLNDNSLSDENQQYVGMIQRNAIRMESFINQLLDLRKVQENKFKLSLQHIDVIAVLGEVVASFQPLAKERSMLLTYQAPNDTLGIDADRDQLETIFFNILSNAFKYSPDDTTIAVTVYDKQNQIIVRIVDQGTGVSDDSLKSIFELFYIDAPTSKVHGKGSGIGLALTKELVNLHQGHIEAHNNVDRGLTISVTLPKKQDKTHNTLPESRSTSVADVSIPAVALPKETGEKTEKPLVLIVEDNEDLVRFLSQQLKRYYEVLTAEDGWIGLKLAKEHMPDLIISDIMMPHMDGITMLGKIRDNVTICHIPIVLLSAKHAIESQIEGMRYGADYYITKPFHIEFLISSIENLLKRRTQFFEALVEKREVLLKPTDVIITDMDEQFLQRVVKTVEEKMSDPEFNIDMVADHLNLGRSTFYKKFKSLTKLTPVEFVRDMRLQRAHQLLNDNLENISQVAYMVGFNNPKYFSTCFKEKYGVSPKEFSKNASET